MTLANMSAEMGAQVGLIAPRRDHARLAHRPSGVPAHEIDLDGWHTDMEADASTHEFDAQGAGAAGGRAATAPPTPKR